MRATLVGGEEDESRESLDLFPLACCVGLDLGVVVMVTPIFPDSLNQFRDYPSLDISKTFCMILFHLFSYLMTSAFLLSASFLGDFSLYDLSSSSESSESDEGEFDFKRDSAAFTFGDMGELDRFLSRSLCKSFKILMQIA